MKRSSVEDERRIHQEARSESNARRDRLPKTRAESIRGLGWNRIIRLAGMHKMSVVLEAILSVEDERREPNSSGGSVGIECSKRSSAEDERRIHQEAPSESNARRDRLPKTRDDSRDCQPKARLDPLLLNNNFYLCPAAGCANSRNP